MKILLASDFHFRRDSVRTKRHDMLLQTMKDLGETAQVAGVNAVVIAGDIFEKSDYMYIPLLDSVVTAFSELATTLAKADCRLIVMVGNHDIYSRDATIHALCPLRYIDNILLVECAINYNGILFVPYCDDLARFRQVVEGNTSKFLFMHQDTQGGSQSPVYVSPEGISPDWVKHFSRVWSGHWHHPSEIANICYVGAPAHYNYSDVVTDIPRGFLMIEAHADGTYTEERITNPHTEYYISLDLTESDRAQDTLSEAQCEVLSSPKLNLRLLLREGQESPDFLKDVCGKVSVHHKSSKSVQSVDFVERNITDADLLRRYVSRSELDPKVKESAFELGQSFMEVSK